MYRDKTVPSPVPPLSRLVGFRFPLIARLGLVLALWLLLVGAALALTPRMAPAAAPLSQTPAAHEVEMAFAVSWSGPISLTASGTYWDVAVGDVNHDGRLDAVATVFLNGGIKGWLGNGTGGWTAMSGLPTTGSYRGVKLADLDVDGQLDVVAASVGNGVRIWRGNGAGGWTAWTGPATSGSYSDVDVGDWNNDSIPDLAATKIANGGITAWRGNGAGTWTLGATNLPSTLTWQDVALYDVNSDGKLDIAAAGDSGVVVFAGNGGGMWTPYSQGLPGSGSYQGVACGDLDRDGDIDLVTTGAPDGITIWTRDSSGRWATAGSGVPHLIGYRKTALADVDNDGRLDILATSDTGGVSCWTGGSNLAFSLANSGLPPNRNYAGLALGDYDDDGRTDLFAANAETRGVQVWHNQSTRPVWTGWSAGNSPNDATDWSDALLVPGGLATVSTDNNCVQLWVGDGLTWAARWPAPCTDDGLVTLASADLNHDSKWDVVAATEATGLRAWVQGATWTPYQTGLPTTGSYTALALGDVNRDGQADLVAVGPGLGVRAWLGGKTSTWTSVSGGLPSTGDFWDVALADLDNDGGLELLASHPNGLGIRIWWWYPPMSNWQEGGLPWLGNYYGLDVGDINDDGKLDIAAARGNALEMYLGDGAGGVITTTTPFTSPVLIYVRDVSLGDANRDGKLDLAAVGEDPVLHLAKVEFWFGDGGRTWRSDRPSDLPSDSVRVAIGPINADGLLDLLVVFSNGDIRPYLAGDLTPPGMWSPFTPTGWVSTTQSPVCSTTVMDSKSGLDVSTAQYAYSTDGGSSWSSWRPATCSGTDATTAAQQISAGAVAFGKDSATENLIRYQICDMAGNCGTSPDRTVKIDTVPPASWMLITGTPPPSQWSNDRTVEAVWRPPVEVVSGIAGYYTVWKRKEASPTTPPVINTTTTSTVSSALDDGNDWYFFVRAVDVAGNWAALTNSLGPFFIDIVPPANPISCTTSPPTGTWQNWSRAYIYWSQDPPTSGSPLGWQVGWNHSATQMPASPEIASSSPFTITDLAEAPDWYVHLRAQDGAGNVATNTLHIGPFMLDRTPPSNPTRLSSTSHTTSVWSADNTVTASWSGATDGSGTSGVAGFALRWSRHASDAPWLSISTGALVTTSAPLEDGDDHYLHLMTADGASNWSNSVLHLGPFFIDTTPPLPWMRAEVSGTTFLLTWSATDAGSGLATSGTFDTEYRVDSGNWLPVRTGTSDTTATWTNVEAGKTYSFRVRAKDKLNHWSDWSLAETVSSIEVRVVDLDGKAVSGAEVWADDALYGHSDSLGVMRGHFSPGTQLIARKVVEVFESPKDLHEWDQGTDWAYRVYLTSVPIDPEGIPLVDELGYGTTVVTLRLSPDNALFGFNVVTSPLWDATDDELAVLEWNLKEASRYLYDATDGQMFLEHIRIYDNALAVPNNADVRHALDINLRAYAGGDGIHKPEWHVMVERYEDAPTIIHEWGHYGLNLLDEYIDADGIEGAGKCTANRGITWVGLASSIMDYQGNTTEFCSSLAGNPHSLDTQQQVGRGMSCWDWIVHAFSDPQGRWKLWMPTDYGIMRHGPEELPVEGWVSTEIFRADTGVCAPTIMTFVDDHGLPIDEPVVFVFPASGSTPLEEGTGNEFGELFVSGIHDKDILEAQDGHGNVVGFETVSCSPGGLATFAAKPSGVSAEGFSPDFRVTVGALPIHGARALFLWSQANAELAAPPVARVWQHGQAALTVTLGYSPTLGLYIGRAALDTEQPLVGTVAVGARSTTGDTARMSSQFLVQGVDAESDEYVVSMDGRARLYLPSGVLGQDSAVGMMPGAFLGRPEGLVPLSYPYHLGVNPASPELNGTGVLTFYLDERKMSQVVPGSAQLYRWEQDSQTWLPAGGTFYPERTLVSGRIAKLGTYAALGQANGESQPVYLPVIMR